MRAANGVLLVGTKVYNGVVPQSETNSECSHLQGQPRTHVVTFYQNQVFTVDDGPARDVNDPANLDFITSISNGECPAELDPGSNAIPVNVNLIRKEEDYVAPK